MKPLNRNRNRRDRTRPLFVSEPSPIWCWLPTWIYSLCWFLSLVLVCIPLWALGALLVWLGTRAVRCADSTRNQLEQGADSLELVRRPARSTS